MHAKISTAVKSLSAILVVLTTVWSLHAADDASGPAEKSTKSVNLGQIAKHGDLSLAEGYTVIGEGAPGIGVRRRPKPATRRRVKIGHWRRSSSANLEHSLAQGTRNGEPAQHGRSRFDRNTPQIRRILSRDRPPVGPRPADRDEVCGAFGEPVGPPLRRRCPASRLGHGRQRRAIAGPDRIAVRSGQLLRTVP